MPTHHHNYALDAVLESFITTFLPVIGRLGLLAKHHRRAMRKKVDWSECRHCICRAIEPSVLCMVAININGWLADVAG